MNKAIYLTIATVLLGTFTSMAQFDKLKKTVGEKLESNTSTGLSQEEIGAGLKEALTKGVEKGVDQLSKPMDSIRICLLKFHCQKKQVL